MNIGDIYSEYFHDIYLYTMSLSKNTSIAEEITQETFFRAMRSLNKFKGESDIKVWLCSIAKNTLSDYYRKEKKICPDNFEQKNIPDDISIEDSLEDKNTSFEIHKILHEMTEPHKEVFTLRVFGELSFSQIGEVFGKTESWARVTFHRAKLKIINKLEENYE